MTATLIEKHNEQSYTLTTEKGREISVYFHSWGAVGVYIQRAGHPGLSAGRQFASVEAAIAGYKAADVKAALAALLPG